MLTFAISAAAVALIGWTARTIALGYINRKADALIAEIEADGAARIAAIRENNCL